MAKRISELAGSLKQLGEIQVTDWDIDELLHKDIKDIEIANSLRKLGNIRVMEWDFRDVLPAVSKLAHQEVDLVNLVRRTANYKVMDWDFRSATDSAKAPAKTVEPSGEGLGGEEMQALVLQLRDFLQYVVTGLIDQPGHSQIKVKEIAPKVLRFRLVLVKHDVSALIGTGGHTAAAIRRLLKTAAGMKGVKALLQIHSHEEEAALFADERCED